MVPGVIRREPMCPYFLIFRSGEYFLCIYIFPACLFENGNSLGKVEIQLEIELIRQSLILWIVQQLGLSFINKSRCHSSSAISCRKGSNSVLTADLLRGKSRLGFGKPPWSLTENSFFLAKLVTKSQRAVIFFLI